MANFEVDRALTLAQGRFVEHRRAMRGLTERSIGLVIEASLQMSEALERGGKVMFVGNGGSAADSQHLAAELVGRLRLSRRPLAAVALTSDTSVLTSLGNDFGFDAVFARQVEAVGRDGDVLIALSTSGRSANVIAAAKVAIARNIGVIALVGSGASPLRQMADVAISVPSGDPQIVQEGHIAVGHVLCELVERSLAAKTPRTEPLPATTKLVPIRRAVALREKWGREGLTVVWTSGCFDILHPGHVATLRYASSLGDVLIVGVNADRTVAKLKGAGRPIFALKDRVALLEAMDMVDLIVSFAEPTPSEVLGRLRPDVFCKGSEYRSQPMPEEATVRAYGGQVAFAPMVGSHSTTRYQSAFASLAE